MFASLNQNWLTEEFNISPSKFDERTFESFFKQHFKSLVFYAQRYVKDLDSAKEIAQNAFISLWEKRESIDLSKPVKTYLTVTVHNRCLNHIRDNKKFDTELLSNEYLIPASEYFEDNIENDETMNRIYSAIEELPEKCKEIFKLSRFDNMKYQQIAEALGISVKTVESQMSKALFHLRSRLADYLIIIFFLLFWLLIINK